MDKTQFTCNKCNVPIYEQFFTRINDKFYHERCVTCNLCSKNLSTPPGEPVYIKNSLHFCKVHYTQLFLKCHGCKKPFENGEPIQKNYLYPNYSYHQACFKCKICKIELQEKDKYMTTKVGDIHCEQHLPTKDPKKGDDSDSDDPYSQKPKRPRTILTSEQRRKFKCYFEIQQKPCRKMREKLAEETGLKLDLFKKFKDSY